jgi:hypothetical protein
VTSTLNSFRIGAVGFIAWLGGDRLIRDKATLRHNTLCQFLPPTTNELARRKLPFLIIWMRGFSYDAIDVISNMLGSDRTPAIDAFTGQINVNSSRHLRGIAV